MDREITIRRLKRSDLEIVLSWRNDPRIRSHMFNADLIPASEHIAWFEASSMDSSRCLLLVLRQGKPFGFAQFNISRCESVAEWGFYVDPNGPPGQGKSLGRSILSFGFKKLKLHRITGQVLNQNTRSIAFHKRMGFRSEGKLRSHFYTGLDYQDVHLFGLLANEWKKEQEI